MKASELIALLSQLPADAEVRVWQQPEGYLESRLELIKDGDGDGYIIDTKY